MSKSSGSTQKPAWDQRGNDISVWKPLLRGKKSGTFVVRTSSNGGKGVVASITIVDRGGGDAFFERRIVSVGADGSGVAIFRSEHHHTSIPALIQFYQDPKYFSTAINLDVPALLIVPGSWQGDGLYEECFWHMDRPPPPDGGGGRAAAAAASNYGPIYEDVDEQMMKRVIDEPVDESIYFSIYNPMDEVAITPLIAFSEAMVILAGNVRELSNADGEIAAAYAAKHPHLGEVRQPGGAALTVDDIAALYYYTMPTDFYSKMNATLGGYDGSDTYRGVDHYLPVTKILVTALEKLPPVSGKLFRGVKMNYKDILKTPEGKDAKVKDVVQWNQFTSCAKSKEVLKKPIFLGVGNAGTVFQIIALNGVNVKPYSYFADEEEVVLPPGSRFVIDAITPCKDGVTEVRMRQIVEGNGANHGGGGDGSVNGGDDGLRKRVANDLREASCVHCGQVLANAEAFCGQGVWGRSGQGFDTTCKIYKGLVSTDNLVRSGNQEVKELSSGNYDVVTGLNCAQCKHHVHGCLYLRAHDQTKAANVKKEGQYWISKTSIL